ncbi:hypothetical protein KPH14_002121 [Odynerus spinipes]|uniref:NADH dehydrogenase [ubiquinone] 1 alpha subcomplex subunit 5 n=1 Tax=Odynerus spinipes TaxID=1348599 RepID=A0AAD9RKW8_9HYME|nr:hypothetical protein KPH14_002121 [Odynerus spinipes]
MAGPAKKVTLAGLKLVHNPYVVLKVLHNKMLKTLAKFPEDYVYRQCTEKIIKDRMDILEKNPERADAEEKLGVKYLEELISQAKLEAQLVQRMQVWKPWESLVEEAPKDQWKWPPHK